MTLLTTVSELVKARMTMNEELAELVQDTRKKERAISDDSGLSAEGKAEKVTAIINSNTGRVATIVGGTASRMDELRKAVSEVSHKKLEEVLNTPAPDSAIYRRLKQRAEYDAKVSGDFDGFKNLMERYSDDVGAINDVQDSLYALAGDVADDGEASKEVGRLIGKADHYVLERDDETKLANEIVFNNGIEQLPDIIEHDLRLLGEVLPHEENLKAKSNGYVGYFKEAYEELQKEDETDKEEATEEESPKSLEDVANDLFSDDAETSDDENDAGDDA